MCCKRGNCRTGEKIPSSHINSGSRADNGPRDHNWRHDVELKEGQRGMDYCNYRSDLYNEMIGFLVKINIL